MKWTAITDEIMWMVLAQKFNNFEIMEQQGNSNETGYSTINQSGAPPLEESGLPIGLPRQPDIMALHHSHIMTNKAALTTLLEQDKLIGTYPIGVGMDPGSPVWQFVHTYSNVAKLHLRSFQDTYKLASWTLHFKFEFRSNFQQVGQNLVVQHNIPTELLSYIFGTGTLGGSDLYKSYKIMTQLPHTKVAMGEDVDVHATMNWNIPLESAFESGFSYKWPLTESMQSRIENIEFGTIAIVPAIPMQVAKGVSPNMTVRVWSRLSNLKLGAYSPVDTIL